MSLHVQIHAYVTSPKERVLPSSFFSIVKFVVIQILDELTRNTDAVY